MFLNVIVLKPVPEQVLDCREADAIEGGRDWDPRLLMPNPSSNLLQGIFACSCALAFLGAVAQLDERLSFAKGISATEGLSYITRMLPPGDTDILNGYVLFAPSIVSAHAFSRRNLRPGCVRMLLVNNGRIELYLLPSLSPPLSHTVPISLIYAAL